VGVTATGIAMPARQPRVSLKKHQNGRPVAVWLSHWHSFLFLFEKKWPSWDSEKITLFGWPQEPPLQEGIIVYVPD